MRQNSNRATLRSWLIVRLKKGMELFVIGFLMLAAFAVIGDLMYEKEDDWIRTLGRNDDFFGKNSEIHTLYLGELPPQAQERAMGERAVIEGSGPCRAGSGDGKPKDFCDLRSRGQKAEESYFLLQRADARYALLRVCLYGYEERDGRQAVAGEITAAVDNGLSQEDMYLQKIISYCESEGLELVFVK